MKHLLFQFLTISFFAFLIPDFTVASNSIPVDSDSGIKGKVLDKTTRGGLEYATVMVYSLPDSAFIIGVISGKDGQFEMKLKPGKYYVTIQFLGYTTLTKSNIQIVKEKSMLDLGQLLIEPDMTLLGEVEVVAEKTTMEMTLDKKVFNIGKDISSTAGNAIEVLENIPSVTVDIDGNVSLRGDEGVRVLIDGKVSGMAGINSRDALRSLQADMIDKIEVVTNPSVRYDAEGSSGIINIVLKKDRRQGFNGSIDANLGYPWQYGIGLNTNYRIKKFNFFTNYSYNHRERIGSGTNYKEIYNEGTWVTDQTSERLRTENSHTIRFGTEYFFTETTSLSGSFMYRTSKENAKVTIDYLDYNPSSELINHSQRIDDQTEKDPNLEYALNFKKQFKKKDQQLTASLQYFNNTETENSDISQLYFDPNPQAKSSAYQKSISEQKEPNLQFQADYVHPFRRMARFETGVKLSTRSIDNYYEVSEKDSTGNYNILENYTNHFFYDETIYAAYALFGDDRGRISYQFGLRSELEQIDTKLTETGETGERKNLDFFPSAHFTFKATENDHMQISYSRRIRRPDFMQLNPFHSFADNRNIFTGNPDLKPVFTDAYELGYIRFWKTGNFNFNTYYRASKDMFQRTESIDSLGITYIKPQNFAKSDAYGFELIGTYTGLKWLNLNANLNFFRNILDGDLDGINYHTDDYSWTGRINSRFTIQKGLDFQLSANYQSASDTPQGKRLAMFTADCGLSKDVLKGKGTFTLNVRDIFGTRRHAFESYGDNFYSRTEAHWGSTVVTLNFNYRINQNKKRQERSQGMGEEGGMDF
jgi:outer membrane receptor protein involved in Fe transport